MGTRLSRTSMTITTTMAAAALLASSMTAAQGAPSRQRGFTLPDRYHVATYDLPYGADSMLNVRPVNPTLDDYQIPDDGNLPGYNQGAYGISVARATAADGPQTILPLEGEAGVWNSDAEEEMPSITVPHFPQSVVPPEGTDGSVAIFDEVTQRVYSFWQLRHLPDGTWHARTLSWGWGDGLGFGDPAHYYQGSRAMGAGNMVGLVRKKEFQDATATMYYHALALTLDSNALSKGVQRPNGDFWGGYTWPATAGDWGGNQNTGKIPEGARLMLPKDFDVDSLPSAELRRLARTLMTYGGFVVDRNGVKPLTVEVANEDFTYQLGDTPFHTPGNTYDQDLAAYNASGVPQGLDVIRKALRMVTDVDGYATANNTVIKPKVGFDVPLLSLRGPWTTTNSAQLPTYDTFDQALVFTQPGIEATNTQDFERVTWAHLKAGERVRLAVTSKQGATLQLKVACTTGKKFDSGELGNRDVRVFTWPCSTWSSVMIARAGDDGWSVLQADLRRVPASTKK